MSLSNDHLNGLTIRKVLTPYNFSDRNDIRRIKYIVIHYFGSLGDAEAVANYFANAYRGASAHYSIDEGLIVYQSVEDEDIAWHCGTTGKYFNDCRNSNSIGIEVRPYKINTKSIKADHADWYFTDQIIRNLVILTAYLMRKYDVPASHVIRHYDVTHKLCPRPYAGDDINLYHKVSGTTMWNKFKTLLLTELLNHSNSAEREDDDVVDFSKLSDAEVDSLLARLNKRFASLPASDYAKESCQKAVTSGIFSDGDKDGGLDNPHGFLKRQEAAALFDRLGLLDKQR